MSYAQDIDKALVAHGAWKQRLINAASSGKSEFAADQVKADNRCDFGQWFYSLPQPVRESPIGVQVQKLHAEFHVEAARVLSIALRGDVAHATTALNQQGTYADLSGRLALALQRWKQQGG